MKYIVSKLSFDQSFTIRTGNHAPYVTVKEITVKGRSNVRDPRTLVVPDGTVTEVSDEDAAIVLAHPLYKMYEKNGMMRVVNSKAGARSAKSDLAEKDGAAQLTEADYKKRGIAPPKSVAEVHQEEEDDE